MTWAEIKRRIARGGLTPSRKRNSGSTSSSTKSWCRNCSNTSRRSPSHPFIYPMFAFAAYTGARRSEICRSMVDDFKFDDEWW